VCFVCFCVFSCVMCVSELLKVNLFPSSYPLKASKRVELTPPKHNAHVFKRVGLWPLHWLQVLRIFSAYTLYTCLKCGAEMGEQQVALPIEAVFPDGLIGDELPRKECCNEVINLHFNSLEIPFNPLCGCFRVATEICGLCTSSTRTGSCCESPSCTMKTTGSG